MSHEDRCVCGALWVGGKCSNSHECDCGACKLDRQHRTPLHDAFATLRAEYPEAKLSEVRIEFRLGERYDHGPSESWLSTDWTVQVGNEHGRGFSLDAALANLREEMRVKSLVPTRAEKIAAVLREIPEEGFERYHALDEAQRILEAERQAKWRSAER